MKKTILTLVLSGAMLQSLNAQQPLNLTAEFDKVVKEQLPIKESGATVLVSSKGKILYQKAIGKANIELNVPMAIDNVLRIGSITKQFTSIAILQLMENGKLDLKDRINRLIPDYPLQADVITIENLLTHTSGIQDYTSIKDTSERYKRNFSPEEMVRYFQNQPLRFQPGTKYEYSNSNYFLLGVIIEKITGKSYQNYLEENIFKPLKMTGSYYADDIKIIKKRAAGYIQSEKGIINAEAISMSQPYAAGSILSTVEDLFKWQQALQSYKLVKKETLDKAFTRYKLINGKEINYGYGFRRGYIQESESIWHGGVINGFMSMALYLPKEDVYVAILTNCNCILPDRATAMLAALAIGKPYTYREIAIADQKPFSGQYLNEEGDQVTISNEEGKLYLQRGRGPKTIIKAYKKNNFYLEDPLITLEFTGNNQGGFDGLTIKTRTARETWKRSANPQGITGDVIVDEKTLELYTGEYEVNPQFSFAIVKEKDQLFLLPAGQEKLQMFASAPNKFYLKVNDAEFEFIIESGKVDKVLMKQGGRKAEAKRVK